MYPSPATGAMIFKGTPIRSTQAIPYETARAFAQSFRRLFAEPRRARQLFIADCVRRGIDRATFTLLIDPERFGTLRNDSSGLKRREAVDATYEFAYAYHDFWRERLLDETPILYEANAALAAHHIVGIVTEYTRAADEAVLELTDRKRSTLAVVREFVVRFTNVYGWDRRPLRALREHYRSHGMDAALAALRSSPQTFGPFRKSAMEVGLIWCGRPMFTYVTDAPARAAARDLPALFILAAEAYECRTTLTADLAAAQKWHHEGRVSLAAATAVAKQYPRSVEEYIGECSLGILRFTEANTELPSRWEALVADLAPMLPPAALSLARQSLKRRQAVGCVPGGGARHA